MGHKESDKTEQLTLSGGFPGGSHSKESACMQGTWDHSLGEEEIPWRREWQPTPVLPGKSHGQRSLVGPAHGVAESQTALSDFPFLRTCTFSTVGSASVTPETVTEDATTVPTGVTQSSHRHTLPHPSPPVQDPGSGPSRDPCSLCPSPAFCGLREAAPIVLDSVLQSEPFVFLLRSRDASPSGRPCAACLPTSRAGPAPCPCHALGVAVARVSETLLPVVRQ